MKEWQVTAVDELGAVVKEVLAKCRERQDGSTAAVLALHGELGAGKTTFMQVVANQLGVSETVVSPTFVVMKKYATASEQFPELVHIDAYRIEDAAEMTPLHFAEELQNPNALIGIEWAEHIKALLPKETIHLTIALTGQERTITLSYGEDN